MTTVLISAVVSLGVWASVQATGAEISMCVKQSGVSYIIGTGFAKQSCSANEQLLTFNVEGPQGIQGPAGSVGPQGPEGGSVKVYDANNVVIGYVIDINQMQSAIAIFDKILGTFEYVNILSGNIFADAVLLGQPVMFESPDCTGQAYFIGNFGGYDANYLILSTNLIDMGSSVYTLDKSIPRNDGAFTYYSFQSVAGCNAITGLAERTLPMINVKGTLDSYTRPFRIGL